MVFSSASRIARLSAHGAEASMTLHRHSMGAGPDVALLHGWGLHGGIFESLATTLSAHHRVHVLDLPGHGRSPWAKGAGDLEGMARLVAQHLPARCALVGWSLGGFVAARIARLFPDRVTGLVLIGTGACGTRRRDFPEGADPAFIEGLGGRLALHWQATVQEFLSVEVRGDDRALETLRTLRGQLALGGAPSTAALEAGLAILRGADLRGEWPLLRLPTLVIAGAHDRLVPPEAARRVATLVPGARFELIDRAAHAPFISRRDRVEPLICEFLEAV
jgi:pimeloyl-[acyl-carrier protein] methyl ester esterase